VLGPISGIPVIKDLPTPALEDQEFVFEAPSQLPSDILDSMNVDESDDTIMLSKKSAVQFETPGVQMPSSSMGATNGIRFVFSPPSRANKNRKTVTTETKTELKPSNRVDVATPAPPAPKLASLPDVTASVGSNVQKTADSKKEEKLELTASTVPSLNAGPSLWDQALQGNKNKVKCQTCLVQNDITAKKCVSCEAPLASDNNDSHTTDRSPSNDQTTSAGFKSFGNSFSSNVLGGFQFATTGGFQFGNAMPITNDSKTLAPTSNATNQAVIFEKPNTTNEIPSTSSAMTTTGSTSMKTVTNTAAVVPIKGFNFTSLSKPDAKSSLLSFSSTEGTENNGIKPNTVSSSPSLGFSFIPPKPRRDENEGNVSENNQKKFPSQSFGSTSSHSSDKFEVTKPAENQSVPPKLDSGFLFQNPLSSTTGNVSAKSGFVFGNVQTSETTDTIVTTSSTLATPSATANSTTATAPSILTTTSSAPSLPITFQFGSKGPTPSLPSAGTFSFGGMKKIDGSVSQSDSTVVETKSTPGTFMFGMASSVPKSSTTANETPSSGGFSFTTKPKDEEPPTAPSSSSFSFGQTSSVPAAAPALSGDRA
jgi:hypothetical protein